MNFWETVFLFFAFQSFLFGVFFFVKRKGDRLPNMILGTYLILFSLNLIYNVLYWSELMYKPENIHFYGVLIILWVLYPPLMYLYARSVLTTKVISLKDSIHLAPLFIVIWVYFPFYILGTTEKLEALKNGTVGAYLRYPQYIVWGVILVMVFYTLLTYFTHRNRKVGLNKKRWFLWVLGSFACYVSAMIIYFIFSRLGLISTEHDYFIMYTIILFIGLMVYFGIMQPEIFEGRSMNSILPFKKYQKTGLSEAHSQELKLQLISYFDTSKPYLKSDLRLSDLAEQLNLSRHHTSQIINEHFDVTFFDFINNYRIEEAKNLLLEAAHLSITDVIYSSGFNNRVSFYKTFKKHTGMTPSVFKSKNINPS